MLQRALDAQQRLKQSMMLDETEDFNAPAVDSACAPPPLLVTNDTTPMITDISNAPVVDNACTPPPPQHVTNDTTPIMADIG
jgi:hypothetical protein